MSDTVKVLSDDALREIEARANAATVGPWHTAKRRPALIVAADKARVADCHVGIGMAVDEAQINAELIAHAREDIPALCATVRVLQAELKNLQVHVEERDSLLDSQADDKEFAKRTPIGIQIANAAATRMRDRCVAKVKLLAQSWEHAAMQWHEKAQADSRPDFKRINYEERDACLQKRDAANVIANNLESLTLEGEQEKR